MEVQSLSSVHPVAIVTGASSGIGLEYARELCARGYDVVMVSNEEERLTAMCRGVVAHVRGADVASLHGFVAAGCGGAFARFLRGVRFAGGGAGE